MIDVKFKKLEENVVLPTYANPGDAGMDIRAYIAEPITLRSLERVLIPTGFAIQLPEGYEAQIRPRSGLAAKYGVTVCNTPGTIDAGYTGEIKVILINLSNEPFTINPGERIAQMVFNKFEVGNICVVEELSKTERGSGGFGSSGLY
jgi:dUTP pyrophosphatase